MKLLIVQIYQFYFLFTLPGGKVFILIFYLNGDTDMRRLTTGILPEKWVVRRFRRCANVIDCTYTNLDSTVKPTTHLGYMV